MPASGRSENSSGKSGKWSGWHEGSLAGTVLCRIGRAWGRVIPGDRLGQMACGHGRSRTDCARWRRRGGVGQAAGKPAPGRGKSGTFRDTSGHGAGQFLTRRARFRTHPPARDTEPGPDSRHCFRGYVSGPTCFSPRQTAPWAREWGDPRFHQACGYARPGSRRGGAFCWRTGWNVIGFSSNKFEPCPAPAPTFRGTPAARVAGEQQPKSRNNLTFSTHYFRKTLI